MTLIDPTSGVGYWLGIKPPSSHLTTIATQQPYALDIVNGGTYTLGGPLSITYNDALTYTLDAAATYTTNVGSSLVVTAAPSTVSYDGDIAFTNVTTTFAFSGAWDVEVDQINLRDDNAGSITVGIEEPVVATYDEPLSVTYTLGVSEVHSGGSSYIYGDTLNEEVTLGYTDLCDDTHNLTINGVATIETNGNTSVTANKPVSVIFSEGVTVGATKAPMGTYSIQVDAYDDILVDDNTPMGTLTTTVEGSAVVQNNLLVTTGDLVATIGDITAYGYVEGNSLENNGFTSTQRVENTSFSITEVYTRVLLQNVVSQRIWLPTARKGTILWLSTKNGGPGAWAIRDSSDTYTIGTALGGGAPFAEKYASFVIVYWDTNTPRVVKSSGDATTQYGPW